MFNSETMSDLSLKYELMRNNEVRINMNLTWNETVYFFDLESGDWFFC
jgi:hypothetical protein